MYPFPYIFYFITLLLLKVCFENSKLFKQFLRHCVADLCVELFNAVKVSNPACIINCKKLFHRVKANIKTFNIDIFRLRKISDSGVNCVCLAGAPVKNPEKNSEVVAESRPNEVALDRKSTRLNSSHNA